jgi:Glycoside Hydrolase Family 113
VRDIYHGPLTYAANWGREFEQIQFWDALDYMGLDNYYPVRRAEKDGIPEIKAAFAKQKAMLRSYVSRYNKPLLFTEIGYMANSKAGMGPHEFEAADSDYNDQYQAACYRAALETYWHEPWFYGMYWWKWFSDPTDRGRFADAHTPHDRPAEKVLQEWYPKNKSTK